MTTMTYDALFNTELFKTLYPAFSNDQSRGAEKVVRRLFAQLHGCLDLPKIEAVVDLGTGDGSFLQEVKRQLEHYVLENPFEAKTNIKKWIGVDRASETISRANQSGQGIDLISCDPDSDWDYAFAKIRTQLTAAGVDWSATALTCFGHTWFHFLEQEKLLEQIRRIRPAVLVISFWHSWDDTVTDVIDGEAHAHEEPLGWDDQGKVLILRSEKITDSTIKRGIARRHTDGNIEWQFETTQRCLKSTDLLGDPSQVDELQTDKPKISGELFKAREQGRLTGDIDAGCDYIVARRFRHPSGWGEMDTVALVPRDPIAAVLNEAWFGTLYSLVKQQFIWPCQTELCQLLSIFDEVENNDGRKKVDRPGDREASIVMPFDFVRAFARAFSLFSNVKDEEIRKHDFILEQPNEFQERFPTGYGHFHTLLARISSSQAFPLSWAYDYNKCKVDKLYDKLETPNLCFTETCEAGTIAAPVASQSPAFFIVPIFFGSLPLFCLVLKFPPRFKVGSTDASVYSAIFENLYRQIRLVWDRTFFQREVLRPFLATALDGLHRFFNYPLTGVSIEKEAPDGSGTCSACRCPKCTAEGVSAHSSCGVIEYYLELIRQHLDGSASWDADFENDHTKLGGALGKPWKSWLLTIPSVPIKELDASKEENRILVAAFREEAQLAMQDHERRLSYWFEQGHFFEEADDGGHEYWMCSRHVARLRRMFGIAGFTFESPPNAADEAWLATAINILRRLEAGGPHLTGAGYFARSKRNFLFEWMTKQFDLLLKAKESCLHKANCNPDFDDVPNCARNEVFQNLKAVFCKSLANHGEKVRFGIRRLFCLLEAATNNADLVQPGTEDRSYALWKEQWKALDSTFWSAEDPSMNLAEFVCAVADMRSLKSVEVTISDASNPIEIKVALNSPLNEKMGGSECDRLRIAFSNVAKLSASISKSPFGVGAFTFSFLVSVKKQQLQFTPTAT